MNAKEILHFDDEINGVYSVNKINNNESIIIIDDESYIKDLSESTKLIILANAIELNEDILNSLKNKKINLLTTTDDINSIIKKIDLSNYVSEMAIDDEAICFKETDKSFDKTVYHIYLCHGTV